MWEPKETAIVLSSWADTLDRISREIYAAGSPITEGGSPAIDLAGSHRLGGISSSLKFNARDLRRLAVQVAVSDFEKGYE